MKSITEMKIIIETDKTTYGARGSRGLPIFEAGRRK